MAGVMFLGNQMVTPVIVQGEPVTYNVKSSSFIGEVNNSGVLVEPTSDINIIFTGVKDLDEIVLFRKFVSNMLVKSVSFPDLEQVTGEDAAYACFNGCRNLETLLISKLRRVTGGTVFAGAFNRTKISEVNFESLEEVISYGVFLQAFANNAYLKKVYFPKLSNLDAESCFYDCFDGCTGIEDIYFNSLTSSSFGYYDDQFLDMLAYTGTSTTHTIHFPSNLQSTIENLLGYPTFGGSASSVVLAFDLPPTE